MKQSNRSRLCALLTAVVLSVLTLGGCTKVTDSSDALQTQSTTSSTTAVTTATTTTAPTQSDPADMQNLTVAQLVEQLGIGWNLGNTLDAVKEKATIPVSPTISETSWGNPKTSQHMIQVVKDAGFNVLRVPTTWYTHMGAGPDYTIDPAWMDRVQEVVDYGISLDMYVILNLHHEDWHFPSYANLDAAKAELTAVWGQIAERFANYDEHLIFEGLNEPRMKGTDAEWTGGTPESRDVVNQLDAAFVEKIRSCGGNNPNRILMVPTYAACTVPEALSEFKVPQDDKVIVSIHAYSPYNFALSDNAGYTRYEESYATELANLMNTLDQTFLQKGVPVVIGEFGARNKDNTADRAAWATAFVKAAEEKGIPCVWWDNGAFTGSGENFGLLKRVQFTWEYPDIVNALMTGLQNP